MCVPLIPQVILLQAHFIAASHKLPYPELPLVPFHKPDPPPLIITTQHGHSALIP
ncbi:hypothetical protein I79_016109 [Cricetulus griseus]|uniref:Uncharacterized protein n=1 Tax=Cricetulus griseus TaxID=10029 RepID=G3HYH6_CRIGR|nr:hypothetical protein I79_016109 [Cricetulus griseus]